VRGAARGRPAVAYSRPVFYRFVRAVVAMALQLFYRIEVNARPFPQKGPLLFVGNHPNSLIDPALIFVITSRQVTFLAKEPLFRMPLLGQLLRGLDALPVYRKQDHPAQMGKNEGTFEAASGALVAGRAITLFPEGKSHSEPQLAELKTGAARIAFRAARQGAKVTVVPVGLTYWEKHRFRSRVLIDVGEALQVAAPLPQDSEGEAEAVRGLTAELERRLRAVTLNLEHWEDLPVIEMGEQLYSFRLGERARDPERLRRFAAGLQIFRAEQPERFAHLRDQVMSFRHRLELVKASPTDLALIYRRPVVYRFVLRNLASLLLGFPLFALGMALYAVPFWIPRYLSRALAVAWDVQATVKLLAVLALAPAWAALLTTGAWLWLGAGWGITVLCGCLPLALFTRYFLERRQSALRDALVFLTLGSRARLKARLLAEGELLAAEIEKVAAQYRPRVVQGEGGAASA
jgi:glycerol-3-phosphate O-acyltransferase / dihydroxyacetone phosphate acyltransferase